MRRVLPDAIEPTRTNDRHTILVWTMRDGTNPACTADSVTAPFHALRVESPTGVTRRRVR